MIHFFVLLRLHSVLFRIIIYSALDIISFLSYSLPVDFYFIFVFFSLYCLLYIGYLISTDLIRDFGDKVYVLIFVILCSLAFIRCCFEIDY